MFGMLWKIKLFLQIVFFIPNFFICIISHKQAFQAIQELFQNWWRFFYFHKIHKCFRIQKSLTNKMLFSKKLLPKFRNIFCLTFRQHKALAMPLCAFISSWKILLISKKSFFSMDRAIFSTLSELREIEDFDDFWIANLHLLVCIMILFAFLICLRKQRKQERHNNAIIPHNRLLKSEIEELKDLHSSSSELSIQSVWLLHGFAHVTPSS